MKMFWWVRLKPIIFFMISGITAIFSLSVLYGEVANFFDIDFKFFNKIVTFDSGYLVSNIIVFVCLGYFMVTVYYGLFSFKVTQWYELYPKHTDSPSLIWSATWLARLIYPLSYNFLEIVQIDKAEFLHVFASLESGTIFGAGVNQYLFPACLLLFFLLNLFNIYRFILKKAGLEQYSFDSSERQDEINEGKAIVKQQKSQFEKLGKYK